MATQSEDTPRGRPTLGRVPVRITLPEALRDKLQAHAAKAQATQSSVVEQALTNYLT